MLERMAQRTRLVLFGGVLLTLCPLAGCGSSKKLDTRPVQGKLVFEKGGSVKSLHEAEATVAFESVDHPGLRATAEIAEDGSLINVISQKQEAIEYGLVPGTYRVRLDLAERRRGLVQPRFLSFEKAGLTVQVPSDTEIVIKVWR